MTFIFHVRYGAKSSEIKRTTEIRKGSRKDLNKMYQEIKQKYERELDVPFPIVDIWKITKF